MRERFRSGRARAPPSRIRKGEFPPLYVRPGQIPHKVAYCPQPVPELPLFGWVASTDSGSVTSDGFDTAIRLSDLRAAHAASATLQNLLSALSAKIDACSRLKVFEYEAGSEGHPHCAAAFRTLAEIERESFQALLTCLREHLDEVSPAEAVQGGQG
jgi:hypothetical protein